MIAIDTEKLIYYRPGNGREAELITKADLKRIHKVWGDKQPYNIIEQREEDHNYGSGLPIVTEIMAVIQCNRNLNERQSAIEARIKKGLTRSQGRSFTYVEQNLVWDLIEDAKKLFVKEGGNLREAFGYPETDRPYIYNYALPYREFFRLFGLPFNSIMDKVKECEEKIGNISKPENTYKVKHKYSCSRDQQGVYKQYYIKGDLGKKGSFVKTGLPYVGKLYQGYDMDYIQIYVYDFCDRNWALQNVIDYLVKNNMITLH